MRGKPKRKITKDNVTLGDVIKAAREAGATVTTHLEPESDLVRLIRDLEAKRLARKESDEVLRKLDEDLQKVNDYYQKERQKLIAQAEATHREIRVQDAELQNVEQVVQQQLGCGGGVKTPFDYELDQLHR